MLKEEELQLELSRIMESTELCKVHRVSSRKGDVRVLFTITSDRVGASRTPEWLRFLVKLLGKLDGAFYTFIDERVFLEQGQLVRGWVVFLDSDAGNTAQTVQTFKQLVMKTLQELRENNAVPPTITMEGAINFGRSANRVKPMMPGNE